MMTLSKTKWALIVVACLFILFLVAPINSSSLPKAITSDCNHASGQQQQICYGYELLHGASLSIEGFLKTLQQTITLLLTLTLVIFTGLLAKTTYGLGAISSAQNKTAQKSERAYVRMSHVDGFDIDNQRVRIEFKNAGRTPAIVIGAKLGLFIIDASSPLPILPSYDKALDTGVHHFMGAGDTFEIRRGFDNIDPRDWGEVTRREKTLYVMGFVEYIDIFEVWHRAGYARRLAYGRPGNNLDFVTERPAYNYDVEIKPKDRLSRDYDDKK